MGEQKKNRAGAIMITELTRVYFKKKQNAEMESAFDKIGKIEKRFRYDLICLTDLLFKIQLNGETQKSVELTKTLISKSADLVKALKNIKSQIKQG